MSVVGQIIGAPGSAASARGKRKVAKKQSDYLVFISHSSKDRWIARQMAAIIERQAKRYGVRTFLDEV